MKFLPIVIALSVLLSGCAVYIGHPKNQNLSSKVLPLPTGYKFYLNNIIHSSEVYNEKYHIKARNILSECMPKIFSPQKNIYSIPFDLYITLHKRGKYKNEISGILPLFSLITLGLIPVGATYDLVYEIKIHIPKTMIFSKVIATIEIQRFSNYGILGCLLASHNWLLPPKHMLPLEKYYVSDFEDLPYGYTTFFMLDALSQMNKAQLYQYIQEHKK